MTTVYFVRHAEPNFENHDDMSRELSEKGLADRRLVTEFLSNKGIDSVLSSPFKRAVDTVKDFADNNGIKIITVNDFRERKVGNDWIEDFNTFCKRQWEDFSYKLSNGESLGEVQCRNTNALNEVLESYKSKTVVIGTHGTALSTIINYYDRCFEYEQFCEIKFLMPWVVRMEFEGHRFVKLQSIDLFSLMPTNYGGKI